MSSLMQVWTAEEVTEEVFRDSCLASNTLGLVEGVTQTGWDVPLQWVGADPMLGDINVDALSAFAGPLLDKTVPVTRCAEAAEEETQEQNMTLRTFLNTHLTASSPEPLYLKDWHLQEDSGTQFYCTPKFLGADFLNDYVHGGGGGFGDGGDYRFVYLGAAKTYTPFHTDVFGSYSWSLNLSGMKEWWFVPAEDMHLLGKEPPLHWMKPFREAKDNESVPYEVMTLTYEGKAIRVVRFYQKPGDLVFVPSGWGHQVWNLTPCLSVNHNWCNAYNIVRMTELLAGEAGYLDRQLLDVKELLEEQEKEKGGYAGHCEWLLHNAANWNVSAWLRLLMSAIAGTTQNTAEQRNQATLSAVAKCLDILAPLHWGIDGLPEVRESLAAAGSQ